MHIDLRLWFGSATLAVLVALPGALHAAAETPKKSPKLGFEERAFDFGVLSRGTKQAHRFKFKNEGDATLVLQGVHAACGCTAVTLDQGKEYAPGEGGEIEVRFDTTDFSGPVVKTVTVMSNERPQPDRLLTLRAEVRAELEASPPLIDFGDVLPKTTPERQLKLRSLSGKPITVSGLDYDQKLLEAKVAAEGKDWVLTVKLKPGLPPGFIKDTIIVKNDSVNLKELKVPVRASVKGTIDVAPAYLEFGAIAGGGKAKRTLALRSGASFKVTGVTSELMINGRRVDGTDKIIKVETNQNPKDKQQVTIELANAAKHAGSVHGKVTIATDEAEAKALTVDFYAFFR